MNRQKQETESLRLPEIIDKGEKGMDGILKVTPEKLIQTSGEFAASGEQMKNLTGEMMAKVQGMKGMWQGEAASVYSAKFHSLQSDMDRLYRMVQEHAADLQEMAVSYQNAEAGNTEHGNSLHADIIV